MSRIFCIPGVLFIFVALVLLSLSSISLPYLPALDVARTKFGTEVLDSGAQGMTELRVSVLYSGQVWLLTDHVAWSLVNFCPCRQSHVTNLTRAYCYYDQDLDRTCTTATPAYQVAISNAAKTASVIIGSSWTRGLAVHPVAAGVAFVAFLLSLSTHHVVTLVASLFAFLASALALIAFAIDIALFVFLRHQVDILPNIDAKTTIGVGFWLTFVSFLLLILGGATVCLGRRHRQKRTDGAATYPIMTPNTSEKKSFWSKFRKN
ncbi:hypothetical protein H2248_002709 [Termitomyces sp. 'cryptogamus']|nr:hypothetical protein H2248_002709 [Termitomyces sp. 'cryptogamus']